MKIFYILIGILLGLLIAPHQVMPKELPIAPIIVSKPSLPLILEKIAVCESNNVAWAKNPYSTASGRFQFLRSSWNYYGNKLWGEELKNKNVFDYEDNTELALYVFKLNGTRDWNASYNCWKPLGKT